MVEVILEEAGPRSLVPGGGDAVGVVEARVPVWINWWGCFLTKNFLLSDENIFTLPFDENWLEPCFLTKMLNMYVYSAISFGYSRYLFIVPIIISVSVLCEKIPPR